MSLWAPPAEFVVRLHADAGGQPGAVLRSYGPGLAVARDRVARTRECRHLGGRKRIAKARERTTNEQGLALPVLAHEPCGIDAGGMLA